MLNIPQEMINFNLQKVNNMYLFFSFFRKASTSYLKLHVSYASGKRTNWAGTVTKNQKLNFHRYKFRSP